MRTRILVLIAFLALGSLTSAAPVGAAVPTPKPAPGGSSGSTSAPAPGSGASRIAPAPAPGAAPQSSGPESSGAAGAGMSTISGAVLLDQDGSGGVSRGDRPVVGTGVRLSGPVTASGATSGDGTFVFAGLPAGSYTVSIGGASRVVVVDGRRAGRADFLLSRSDGAPSVGLPAPALPTPTPEATATPKPLPTPATAPGAVAPAPPEPGTRSGPGGASGPLARPAPGYRPNPGPSSGAAAPRAPLVNSPVRYAPGLSSPSSLKIVRNDRALWLGVPFISQLDGTLYGDVNCGPASTAMVLGAFGIRTSPAAVRNYVNDASGNYSADAGTSLEHLGRAVRESGLEVSHLHNPGGGYLRWSTDLVRQQVEAGRPVVTLVKYRALPSHSGSLSDFDHYIVIAGLAGNDFIYNDAAFGGERGFGLLIGPRDLERAWDYSSVPRHGMAVGLTAESLAGRKARIEGAAGDPLLDLGEEVSDEMLLDGVEAELGDELWQSGDYSGLSWGRVEVEANPSEEPPAQPTAAPTGQSGLDLAGFVGVESGPGAPGQPRPLQGIAAPVAEPGPNVPIPLLVLGFGLLLSVGVIASRRLLEA